METEIKEMLESYKRMYRELDESGGPAENGVLFESIIMLEEDILDKMELPPAQKYRTILWGEDLDGVMKKLEDAKYEYEHRPIKDPTLILVDAIFRRINEPENILPLAGFSHHSYQIFLYQEKLLNADTPAETDAIIEEMRTAEGRLGDIGTMEFQGIRKNMELYRELRDAGMNNLDEFLIVNDAYDLDEADMGPRLLCLRGYHRAQKGRLDEAINDFSEAIRQFPGIANIYYNRALVYDMKNETGKAMDDYCTAIDLDPNDMKAYTNRGLLRAEWEWYKEAIEDFDRAITLSPTAYQPVCNRANAHAAMGKHEEAVEDFTRALMLRPDEAFLYCNRGISYFQLGRRDRCLADMKKAAGMGFELAEEFMMEYFPEERTEH